MELTLHEMKLALEGSGYTTPGEDQLCYVMFRQLPDEALESIFSSLVWLSTEAVAFFTPRPPFFSLLASFVSSHLLRDSLCTALQTRRLWI